MKMTTSRTTSIESPSVFPSLLMISFWVCSEMSPLQSLWPGFSLNFNECIVASLKHRILLFGSPRLLDKRCIMEKRYNSHLSCKFVSRYDCVGAQICMVSITNSPFWK